MEHFYETIPGWFDFQDYYKYIVEQAKSGDHFVEVGTWKGKSAAFMAVEIINSRKNIKFDCVDIWERAEDCPDYHGDGDVQLGTLFHVFTNYMKPVENYYKALKMPSVIAASTYDDDSLDFVFIDAAHDYENVRKDVSAWFPKVKLGGIIAGHDFPHGPVAKGVLETLPEANSPLIASCWQVVKTKQTKYSPVAQR